MFVGGRFDAECGLDIESGLESFCASLGGLASFIAKRVSESDRIEPPEKLEMVPADGREGWPLGVADEVAEPGSEMVERRDPKSFSDGGF
jgi:hypothetical protein